MSSSGTRRPARVLWLSNETPDVRGQGGQRRQYHQIAALRARGHAVHVMTLAGPQDDASIARIAPTERFDPFLPRGIRHPVTSRAPLRRARSGRFDALVVAHLESWRWLRPGRSELPVPVLLDLHNVYSDWYRRRGLPVEAARYEEVERRVVAGADAVSVCSEQEADRLVRTIGSASEARVLVAPHGIDAREWALDEVPPARDCVALFGNWDWLPNRLGLEWFVSEVWPRVRHERPDARTEIAGAGVPSRVGGIEGIRVHGRVPDLHGFLATAGAVAVPVRVGVGASVKFAEALAAGRPVIATTDGAAAAPGAPAAVSDDPEAWAAWILARLSAPRAWPDPARAYALAELTWDRAVEPVAAWLRSVTR